MRYNTALLWRVSACLQAGRAWTSNDDVLHPPN